MRKIIILLNLVILIIPFYWSLAGDCEIVIPPEPHFDIDKIQTELTDAFINIIFEYPDGSSIEQTGYAVHKDNYVITSLPGHIPAKSIRLQNSKGESSNLTDTILYDPLANILYLKFAELKCKSNPLEVATSLPDRLEKIGLVSGSYTPAPTLQFIKVSDFCIDAIYTQTVRLENTPGPDFNGSFAIDHEGQLTGIVKSFKTDSSYVNVMIPLNRYIESDDPGKPPILSSNAVNLPAEAYQLMDRGLLNFWEENFETANENFMDYILQYESNPVILMYSSFCDARSGDIFGSQAKVREIRELGCKHEDIYLRMGAIYCILDKQEEAFSMIDTALQINPDNITAIGLRGSLYSIMGNYEKAMDDYERVLKVKKHDPNVMAGKAIANMNWGNYDYACEIFQDILYITRTNSHIYIIIANMFINLDDRESAENFIDMAIQSDPNDEEVYLYIANDFFERDMYDSAITYYEKSLECYEHLYEADYNLGLTLISIERFEEAVSHLENAVEIYSDDFKLLRSLGSCYGHLKRNAEAIATLEKAVKLNPNSGIAHYDLAIAYTQDKNYDQAWEHFDRAQFLGFMRRELFFQRGKMHVERGDISRAERDYKVLQLISAKTAYRLKNLMEGNEDILQDSTTETHYEEMINRVKNSIVNITGYYESNYFFSMNMGVYAFRSYRYGNIGWGLVLDDTANLIMDALYFRSATKAYFTCGKQSKITLKQKDYAKKFNLSEIDKTQTVPIRDDYIVFSSKIKGEKPTPPPYASTMPEIGDSLLVYYNPMSDYEDYFIGAVKGINPDPQMGMVLTAQAPFVLDGSLGIAINMQGEVVGMIGTEAVQEYNLFFVYPLSEVCYFNTYKNMDIEDYGSWRGEIKKRDYEFTLGQIYTWLGNYNQAMAHFEPLYNENDRDEDVAIYYGYALAQNDRIEDAEKVLKRLYKRNPKCYNAYFVLGKIYRQKYDNEEAERYFKKTLKFYPDHLRARYELARIYIFTGRSEDAMKEYEKIKEKDPALAAKVLE